ncbi:hypothetical protein [Aeromonas hydrophila]|uniref:hypothetical protein n=1 Tax=Aeromonas hydrophila TaxID=644 RepID=UPI00035D2B48|nr:hypothetical protein [Aeromonas hydrophila]
MKIRCTSSGLGVESGTNWPVIEDKKSYWIAVVYGVEKKIIKSTGLFAGAPKNGPSFRLVTVTEIHEELSFDDALMAGGDNPLPLDIPAVPVRRRGRPATGKALSAAEKQARYRARKAKKTITVTFNRDAAEVLELHIRALAAGHDAPLSPDMLQSMLDSIRSATQSQLVSEAV